MSNSSIDVQVQSFNEHCLSILDEVAPVKSNAARLINSTPWINDSIRSFKHICHKTEHLWKSTQQLVHYQHLKKGFLMDFNNKVKDARIKYFSNLTPYVTLFLLHLLWFKSLQLMSATVYSPFSWIR